MLKADKVWTGLDLTKQVIMRLIQHKQSSWIPTNKTWAQPCSNTSPYEVNQHSLTVGVGDTYTYQGMNLDCIVLYATYFSKTI